MCGIALQYQVVDTQLKRINFFSRETGGRSATATAECVDERTTKTIKEICLEVPCGLVDNERMVAETCWKICPDGFGDSLDSDQIIWLFNTKNFLMKPLTEEMASWCYDRFMTACVR